MVAASLPALLTAEAAPEDAAPGALHQRMQQPVLALVLSFVSQGEVAACCSVSRSWHLCVSALSTAGVAWVNLDLQGNAAAGAMLKRCAQAQPPSPLVAVRSSVRRLLLLFCKRLQDGDLSALSAFPALTDVELGGCHALTDQGMHHLALSSPSGPRRLQRLSLYWCPQLDDKVEWAAFVIIHAVFASADRCPLIACMRWLGGAHSPFVGVLCHAAPSQPIGQRSFRAVCATRLHWMAISQRWLTEDAVRLLWCRVSATRPMHRCCLC